MFHVEQAGTHGAALDPPGFLAPARQQQFDDDFFWCTARQYTCKTDGCQVFFARLGKIFFKRRSLRGVGPRAHPGSITREARDVKDFLRQLCKIVSGQKPGGANYSAVPMRCQVLFAQFPKINQLTSLCGESIIGANCGKPRHPRNNLRKFWTIAVNNS